MYKRRNTLVKKYILLFFLQIIATTIKIKTKTITKITKIITKITETLAVIKHINNQILTANLRDVAIFTKKRIIVYKDIQRRNIIRLKKSIKAALIIKLKDSLITALKNTLSSILLTVKETIIKTQRILIKSLKPLLQILNLNLT